MSDNLYTRAVTGCCDSDPQFEAAENGYDALYGPSLGSFGDSEATKTAFVPIDQVPSDFTSSDDIRLSEEDGDGSDAPAYDENVTVEAVSATSDQPSSDPADDDDDPSEAFYASLGSIKHRRKVRRRVPSKLAPWKLKRRVKPAPKKCIWPMMVYISP